jgi:hypothetical protein
LAPPDPPPPATPHTARPPDRLAAETTADHAAVVSGTFLVAGTEPFCSVVRIDYVDSDGQVISSTSRPMNRRR